MCMPLSSRHSACKQRGLIGYVAMEAGRGTAKVGRVHTRACVLSSRAQGLGFQGDVPRARKRSNPAL